jgi:hypothetical protein
MDIGRAPNDAVHDCGDRPNDYNGIKAARSNDAALHPGESADGKMDPF